jgi:hypothetical protein
MMRSTAKQSSADDGNDELLQLSNTGQAICNPFTQNHRSNSLSIRETTAWMQEAEQRRERLPRVGVRVTLQTLASYEIF